jgi:hypothetical protein
MFAVRYCTAGIWHTVRFLSLGSATLFLDACVRATPRHVSACELTASCPAVHT